MLKALLLIAKILGFTVLGILGLVLLILLIVLLSPIRYSVDASGKVPKITAELGISWLLKIVSVRGGYYGDEGIAYRVKLFGITILPKKEDPEKPKEPKKAKKPKKPKKAKKPKKSEAPGEGQEAAGAEAPEQVSPAEGAAPEPVVPELPCEPEPSTEELIDEIVFSETAELDTGRKARRKQKKAEKEAEKAAEKAKKAEEKAKKAGEPKLTVKERFLKAVEALVEKLQAKAEVLQAKKAELEAKGEKAMAFVEDPGNQKAFRLIKKQLLRILKHYKPRMVKGWFRLGLSDPAATGRILGAYYGLFCKYYEDFRLYGEFDEEVMEGEFRLKGHIRLIHLAVAGVKIILNKNIRSWIKH